MELKRVSRRRLFQRSLDQRRQPLRGPSAVKAQMIEAKLVIRKVLRAIKDPQERERLEHIRMGINLTLHELRRKKPRPKLYYDFDDLSDRGRVMSKLAKELGRGRDVIYHGTRNLRAVMRTGKLLPPHAGERGIFFSRSAELAAHFACLQGAAADERRTPGVLVLDKRSLSYCYRITPSRYDQFSARNEREEVIWHRPVNFRRHLIGVVSDADVTAKIGPARWLHLPRGFAQWPAERRRKFAEREIAAGHRLVGKGRARVRKQIIKERSGR
jgi:hypothetical protein